MASQQVVSEKLHCYDQMEALPPSLESMPGCEVFSESEGGSSANETGETPRENQSLDDSAWLGGMVSGFSQGKP